MIIKFFIPKEIIKYLFVVHLNLKRLRSDE